MYTYIAELQTICTQFHQRICELESDKFDLERGSNLKKLEVTSQIPHQLFFYKNKFD